MDSDTRNSEDGELSVAAVRAELVEAPLFPLARRRRTAPFDAACGVAQDRLRQAQGERAEAQRRLVCPEPVFQNRICRATVAVGSLTA